MVDRLFNIFMIVIMSYMTYSFLGYGALDNNLVIIPFVIVMGLLHILLGYRVYKSFTGGEPQPIINVKKQYYIYILLMIIYSVLLYFIFTSDSYSALSRTIFTVGGIYLAFIFYKDWKKSSNN